MRPLLLVLVFFASCQRPLAVGDDLCVCLPQDWKGDTFGEIAPENFWWHHFDDETLNALEERAIACNKDLQLACERILEAKAKVGIAFSKRLPDLSLDTSISRQNLLIDVSDYSPDNGDRRTEQASYAFPVNFSYEFDFWGKFLRADLAERARLLASSWGYQDVFRALTSEVASLYLNLRILDEEIGFLEKAVEVRELTEKLFAARVKAGLDSEIDLARSKLEKARAMQDLLDTLRLRVQVENGLARLVGQYTLDLPKDRLPEKNPAIFASIPSEVLLNRPDVREKTELVQAALEEIGVAKAEFFPSIRLTTGLGLVSPQLKKWFTWKDRFWSLAFNTAQFLFDGGRRRSNLLEKRARYCQAITSYQRQVEIAFEEVENALNERHYRFLQSEEQDAAAASAHDTANLAKEQFKAGLINYLLVADAEKTELDVKREAIRLRGAEFLATVQLIKALGLQNSCPRCN